MQMALHPSTADLVYVDQLCTTAVRATEVKNKIASKVVSLTVTLGQRAADDDDVGGSEVPAKRKAAAALGTSANGAGGVAPLFVNAGSKVDKAKSSKLAGLGLLKKAAAPIDPAQLIIPAHVHAELRKFQEVEPGTHTADLSLEGILKWWRKWQHAFPFLTRVSRVVYEAPASSAVVERDFSDAGRMMMSSRSSTDTAYVEMIIFLHGNNCGSHYPASASAGRGGGRGGEQDTRPTP